MPVTEQGQLCGPVPRFMSAARTTGWHGCSTRPMPSWPLHQQAWNITCACRSARPLAPMSSSARPVDWAWAVMASSAGHDYACPCSLFEKSLSIPPIISSVITACHLGLGCGGRNRRTHTPTIHGRHHRHPWQRQPGLLHPATWSSNHLPGQRSGTVTVCGDGMSATQWPVCVCVWGAAHPSTTLLQRQAQDRRFT